MVPEIQGKLTLSEGDSAADGEGAAGEPALVLRVPSLPATLDVHAAASLVGPAGHTCVVHVRTVGPSSTGSVHWTRPVTFDAQGLALLSEVLRIAAAAYGRYCVQLSRIAYGRGGETLDLRVIEVVPADA